LTIYAALLHLFQAFEEQPFEEDPYLMSMEKKEKCLELEWEL
jgi:hypothetical protein